MAQLGLSLFASMRAASIALMALALGLGGASALSQEASPAAEGSTYSIVDDQGNQIGEVTVWQEGDEVYFAVDVTGLEPGEHGIHLHAIGACDTMTEPPFDSAGGHFNPDDTMHGPGKSKHHDDKMGMDMGMATPAMHGHGDGMDSHAGDLGNITVGEDGSAMVTISTSTVTLEPGLANTLADDDGTALVIHADADDLMTDPSGNSGGRIACAVIVGASTVGTPVATPVS